MARSITLSEKQVEVAAYLAAGMSQGEAANKIGVARQTVARWNTFEEFKSEVERRKNQAIAAHQETADRLQRQEIESFYTAIEEYRETVKQTSQRKVEVGKFIFQKVVRRLKDLPEEAIAPRDIAPLLKAASDLIKDGLEDWGQLLGANAPTESEDVTTGFEFKLLGIDDNKND